MPEPPDGDVIGDDGAVTNSAMQPGYSAGQPMLKMKLYCFSMSRST